MHASPHIKSVYLFKQACLLFASYFCPYLDFCQLITHMLPILAINFIFLFPAFYTHLASKTHSLCIKYA